MMERVPMRWHVADRAWLLIEVVMVDVSVRVKSAVRPTKNLDGCAWDFFDRDFGAA